MNLEEAIEVLEAFSRIRKEDIPQTNNSTKLHEVVNLAFKTIEAIDVVLPVLKKEQSASEQWIVVE